MKKKNKEECNERRRKKQKHKVSSCTRDVPLIRLLIPSRLTNTLSMSSLPVNSSAITYRLCLTDLAASNMAWTRQYMSVTDRERKESAVRLG